MLDETMLGMGFSEALRGAFGPGGGDWPRGWGEAPLDAEQRAEWIYANTRRDALRRSSPAVQLTVAAIDSFIRYDNMIRLAELDALKDGP